MSDIYENGVSRRTFIKKTTGTMLIIGLGSVATSYGSVPTGSYSSSRDPVGNSGAGVMTYYYSGCGISGNDDCTYKQWYDEQGKADGESWVPDACKYKPYNPY